MSTRSWFGSLCSAAALSLALGCAGDDDGPVCSNGGRDFREGDSWTCADGCNSCTCADGQVTSTFGSCSGPPGPAATKLMCADGEFEHSHGSSWACSDGCGMCGCDDGTLVRADSACDDGAAGG